MSDSSIDPFASEEITPAISAEWQAKRRVASALRVLSDIWLRQAAKPKLVKPPVEPVPLIERGRSNVYAA